VFDQQTSISSNLASMSFKVAKSSVSRADEEGESLLLTVSGADMTSELPGTELPGMSTYDDLGISSYITGLSSQAS